MPSYSMKSQLSIALVWLALSGPAQSDIQDAGPAQFAASAQIDDFDTVYTELVESRNQVSAKDPFETDEEFRDRQSEKLSSMARFGEVLIEVDQSSRDSRWSKLSVKYDLSKSELAFSIEGFRNKRKRTVEVEVWKGVESSGLTTLFLDKMVDIPCKHKRCKGETELTLVLPMTRDDARSITVVENSSLSLNYDRVGLAIRGRVVAPYVDYRKTETVSGIYDVIGKTYSIVITDPSLILFRR